MKSIFQCTAPLGTVGFPSPSQGKSQPWGLFRCGGFAAAPVPRDPVCMAHSRTWVAAGGMHGAAPRGARARGASNVSPENGVARN